MSRKSQSQHKLFITYFSLAILIFTYSASLFSKSCEQTYNFSTVIIPPFNFLQDNEMQGFAAKEFRKVLKEKKLKGKVSPYNWARSLHLAQTGKVDGIYPTLKSKDREVYLDFSLPPLGYLTLALYKKKGSKSKSLNNKSIVVILRSIEHSNIDLSGAKIIEVTKFEQAYNMLIHDRTDFILGVKEALDSLPINSKLEIFKVIESRPIYLALAKESPNYSTIKKCLK